MKTKTCPDCNGDGVVNKGTDDEHQCPTCGGRGFVPDDDDHEDVIKTSSIKPSLAATAEHASRLSRLSVSGVNVNRESNVVASQRERRANARQKRKTRALAVSSPTFSKPPTHYRHYSASVRTGSGAPGQGLYSTVLR